MPASPLPIVEPDGNEFWPAVPAPVANCVAVAVMLKTTQCHQPLPVGASTLAPKRKPPATQKHLGASLKGESRELVLVCVVRWLADRNTFMTAASRIVARCPGPVAAENLVAHYQIRRCPASAPRCMLGLGSSVFDVMNGGLCSLADRSPDFLDWVLSR